MVLIAQIAPMLLALAAQAAEPTGTVTLACQGATQWSNDAKPEPTSMGIIIDFGARTLKGFGSDDTFRIQIVDVTETTITFTGGGADFDKTTSYFIQGTIDRVTGAVTATFAAAMKKTKDSWSASYMLKCKPTQRMF